MHETYVTDFKLDSLTIQVLVKELQLLNSKNITDIINSLVKKYDNNSIDIIIDSKKNTIVKIVNSSEIPVKLIDSVVNSVVNDIVEEVKSINDTPVVIHNLTKQMTAKINKLLLNKRLRPGEKAFLLSIINGPIDIAILTKNKYYKKYSLILKSIVDSK